MLSIPSHLDNLVATDPFEDEEIEVSLESDVYSIMVSQENRVQSVVDVPRATHNSFRLNLKRRLRPNPTSNVPTRQEKVKARPTSPLERRGRSSVYYDSRDTEEGRERSRDRAARMVTRREQSCPPLRHSGSLSKEDDIQKRDFSLPPLRRSSTMTDYTTPSGGGGSSQRTASKPSLLSRKSRKPNLVTSTVSSNGKVLKRMKNTRKKQVSRRNLF